MAAANAGPLDAERVAVRYWYKGQKPGRGKVEVPPSFNRRRLLPTSLPSLHPYNALPHARRW